MGPGRRQDAIPEGRDRPLPGRMLLRDQSVGAGLYPLIVFICRHGVPNSGRLLSTSDAEVPVDAAALREEVRSKYREVAIDPHGKYHFHTVRPWQRASATI